ncbi:PAS/PAC sensor signal transduction histidine kinase [Methanoregula boonei 6A8]|uniref:histidine kinase n=1 Tax=Methanoregula boonei (strain DSM 21154 / JCM 14090 / 6A8) TaxID=456442 RepID=A7I7Q7_METB6|nr:ATP-binding protein [Methanoregula boonei]ABS55768.1 PAS/PAC sensor signal transduction histidine kinase [Methanoregula boonei 6A8]
MERESEQERIRELLKGNPKGLTIEEVSKKLGLNRSTAAKYLTSLVVSGQADMRTLGPAKLFYLTQRLPMTNLLSLASDLILILDQDLFIQEANNPFLSFFHQTKAALKGVRIEHSPLASYFGGEHLAALTKALEGEETAFETRFENEGSIRYFRTKCIPLVFEEGGRAAGIIFEDITEMKQYQHDLEEQVRLRTAELEQTNTALKKEIAEHTRAEESLARNERRLRRAEGVAHFGNWEYYHEEKRVFVSEGMRTLYGISGNEPTLDELGQITLPEYRPVLGAAVRDLIRENKPFNVEYRIQRPVDGTVVDVQSIAEYDPARKAVFGVVHDISETKRAEDAIRKATKQILLLNSVTRHDILNQLNTLLAYLDLTKKSAESNRAILDLVQREQSVAETIRRQITFTRDYQSIGIQPPQWYNVKATVAHILETTDLGGISVFIDTANLEEYADSLIEKVYANLIDNTVRHGGNVSEIRLSYTYRDEDLVILYEDNGTGVSPDDKEQIFERGFGHNTGYGLFLVKEILSITGLSIKETGHYGKGARFEILVPKGAYRFPEPSL